MPVASKRQSFKRSEIFGADHRQPLDARATRTHLTPLQHPRNGGPTGRPPHTPAIRAECLRRCGPRIHDWMVAVGADILTTTRRLHEAGEGGWNVVEIGTAHAA